MVISADNKLFFSVINTHAAQFDAAAFALKNKLSLGNVAFIHSAWTEIDAGSSRILQILFESLVPVAKIINSDQIPVIERTIKSAA